ncbi:SMYD3 methyltransferase, partial [Amia calva]|nr:SMYD3 methyltransferase [Amia calva]
MLAGDERAGRVVREAVTTVEQLQAQQQWEQALALCKNVIHNHGDVLPDSNIHLVKMLDSATDACVNLARWDGALHYSTRTLWAYGMYYPQFHPARAVQLVRVGKLQLYLEKFREALVTLKQAYDVMKVTHGAAHPLTCDVERMLGECRAELDRA